MKFKLNKKKVKKLISLFLVISWLLAGWPPILKIRFENSDLVFPPRIERAKAITCGFGSEIGTTGVCRGFLTTTGSNQTWTSPSDWNNSNNTIECIGAGGSGGAVKGSSTATATGGGGGAYSLINDFYVANPGTTQITYRIGLGGTSVSSSGTATGGNTGEDTWFNNSTFPGSGTNNSYCGAKGGSAGAAGTATQSGGAGGVDTSGWGETRRSGGSGGTASHSSVATGGGGAAGDLSTGGNGVSSTATSQATNGGQANGSGATGGTGGTTGGTGNDGTEYTTEGSGGGGGGGRNTGNAVISGGSGGKRGGGGGGVVNYRTQANGSASSGAGYAGIIIVTYTPILDPSYTQNHYRWYVNPATTSENVTDPWSVTSGVDLAEDTAITPLPYAYDPRASSQQVRLRINLTVNDTTIANNSKYFKMQFRTGTDTDCSTGSWTDVGAAAGAEAWVYTSDTTVADDTTLTVAKLTGTDRLETYSRIKPANTPTGTSATGEDIEFDFHITGGTAFSQASRYLFRVVETTSDGSGTTALNSYSNCPVLHTEPGTENLMRHGEFFSGESEQGFFWAD